MLASPVDKDDLAPFAEMKRVFEKSVVSTRDDPGRRGARARDARREEAGHGHPRARAPDEVVGRTARVDIAADTVLTEDAARVRKVCVVVGSRANYS